MRPTFIQQQRHFDDLCDEIRSLRAVAFDTEFVSEDTYRPELCLVQFATAESCVAVDPYTVDLSQWWELMASPDVLVVVHSAKEEILFCLRNHAERPQNIVDIQVAEGFRQIAYPMKYERLVRSVLGVDLSGTETRSDWRRRPLTPRQIEYALDDVRHPLQIWAKQREWLEQRGRLHWAEEEFENVIERHTAEFRDGDWRKLSGLHRLKPRDLAVARELFNWREESARRRNIPVRRVLRDDLILELARRRPRTRHELLSGRDFNRRHIQRDASEILACVKAGMAVSDDQLPAPSPKSPRHHRDDDVIPKLMGLALADRCCELSVAPSLIGTQADLREFMRWHQSGRPSPPPRLATGWRAEVSGDFLTAVLEGRVCVRVDPANPKSLTFAPHQ